MVSVAPGLHRPAGQHLETILLATDLTAASSAATNQAIDLAVRLEARLLVVTVMESAKVGVGRRGARPETRAARARPRSHPTADHRPPPGASSSASSVSCAS